MDRKIDEKSTLVMSIEKTDALPGHQLYTGFLVPVKVRNS